MRSFIIITISMFCVLHAYAQKPQLTVEDVDSIIKMHIETPCSVSEAIIELNEILPKYYVRYECFTDYSPKCKKGMKKDIITRITLKIPQNEYCISVALDIRTKDPNNQNNKQCWCLKKDQIGCDEISPNKWKYRRIKHYIVLSIDTYIPNK